MTLSNVSEKLGIDQDNVSNIVVNLINDAAKWMTSPNFYGQLLAIALVIAVAWLVSRSITSRLIFFRTAPQKNSTFYHVKKFAFNSKSLVFPLLLILLLSFTAQISEQFTTEVWIIRIAQSLSQIYLLYVLINRFLKNPLMNALARWIGIPIATLSSLGFWDEVTESLQKMSMKSGNLELSVYSLGQAAFFGMILFWLGRISNNAGKKAIRSTTVLDVGAKEIVAKLFEIGLFVALAIIMLNLMSIDLSAVLVFGGALGVGLGLGLQQIAANFISGLIILIDRSVKIGDYVELEDGRSGFIRALDMRSARVETFDGKDIMVPNLTFINTSFTNWTRHDSTQRYEVEFTVAYTTDVSSLEPLIVEAVAKHPKVLMTPEPPDLELRAFGDAGLQFGLEYWIDGIDDGKNKIASDILYIIWNILKTNNIEVPYPHHVVMLKDKSRK